MAKVEFQHIERPYSWGSRPRWEELSLKSGQSGSIDATPNTRESSSHGTPRVAISNNGMTIGYTHIHFPPTPPDVCGDFSLKVSQGQTPTITHEADEKDYNRVTHYFDWEATLGNSTFVFRWNAQDGHERQTVRGNYSPQESALFVASR